jgi:hypothetical protein
MREKYLQAAQTLALMPGSHVAAIVKAVKHSATPEFLARNWLLSALPRDVLEKLAAAAGLHLSNLPNWGFTWVIPTNTRACF